MEITWLGHGCFRLRGRDAAVLMNPCPPSTGYKIGKVSADLVTISGDSPESSYRQALQNEPKFLNKPGEYDVAGVLVTGVRTHATKGDEKGRNVAFIVDLDDVRVCHLGDISQTPHADDVEALGSADVLIVPVGGGSVLDAARAAEAVSLLEPKIVIPTQYKTDVSAADLDGVDKFLREMGAEAKAAEARLNVTKSTLPSDTTIVLLNYRGA
ncbi:MAG TPA: MBL fold metallo-hydrolase [Dehalococcoidia bacterium]|nr:MBL fold metallo-hydrolase [Dehalococcoidia bacterium]